MRQKFNLYSTSLCSLFKDYIETRSSEWEEDKELTSVQVRAMVMNNYNNLLTSGRWFNKDPKDDKILALVGVAQKIVDDSKKSSEKSNKPNMESTKVESSYTRDLRPWILKYPIKKSTIDVVKVTRLIYV